MKKILLDLLLKAADNIKKNHKNGDLRVEQALCVTLLYILGRENEIEWDSVNKDDFIITGDLIFSTVKGKRGKKMHTYAKGNSESMSVKVTSPNDSEIFTELNNSGVNDEGLFGTLKSFHIEIKFI